MKTPALISSAQACQALGISRSTLTYWILTGRLTPAQTLEAPSGRNTQYLFDPADVDRLARERAQVTA